MRRPAELFGIALVLLAVHAARAQHPAGQFRELPQHPSGAGSSGARGVQATAPHANAPKESHLASDVQMKLEQAPRAQVKTISLPGETGDEDVIAVNRYNPNQVVMVR
jgi:hypothetical protein